MKKSIVVVIVLVIVMVAGVSYIILSRPHALAIATRLLPGANATPIVTAVAARPYPKLPVGSATYQIMGKPSSGPEIIQATINPPDVHVGDIQKLSVVVSAAEQPSFVTAFIGTDHGTTTLVLAPEGTVSASSLPPRLYAVDDAGHVVPASNLAKSENFFTRIAEAIFGAPSVTSAASNRDYLYQGSWTVKDTHNTYYQTTFVAEGSGKSDSVTLAWSDACGIPQGGGWTISANCDISSLDGVDQGSVTISNYTLTLNAQFTFNPIYTMTIGSGGSVAIGGGGSIVLGYLYNLDHDGDRYPAFPNQYFSANSFWAGYGRRSIEFTSLDCNDNNASVWQDLPEYIDGDGDGFGVNPPVEKCSGAGLVTDSGYSVNNTDCYDLDLLAYPGSAAASIYARGGINDSAGHTGNSYDYNCDGVQTLVETSFVLTPVATSNCAAVNGGAGCISGTYPDCTAVGASWTNYYFYSTSSVRCGEGPLIEVGGKYDCYFLGGPQPYFYEELGNYEGCY